MNRCASRCPTWSGNWLLGPGVLVGRGVSCVGLASSQTQVPDARYRHAWHVRARSATRAQAAPAGYSHRLHHRARRRDRSPAHARRRRCRMPSQAFQRCGPAKGNPTPRSDRFRQCNAPVFRVAGCKARQDELTCGGIERTIDTGHIRTVKRPREYTGGADYRPVRQSPHSPDQESGSEPCRRPHRSCLSSTTTSRFANRWIS